MTNGPVLAIDQGTHATRAIVFDNRGRQLAAAHQPVALRRLSHSAVEQDAMQILASTEQVIAQVLADPALAGCRPVAAGLATQRSSVVAWRRSDGMPLAPLLSWQDTRSADFVTARADTAADTARRTGLRLSPHYGAGKLHWLLAHDPAVRQAAADGDLCMGPLAAFLLHRLLAQRPVLVDEANASRTLLWNLTTRDWDPVLLQRFEVPRHVLPECRPIVAGYGALENDAIPLRAVNGDQTAALYAQGRPPPRTLIVNIGTGAFVLLPVDDPAPRPDGLLAGISYSDGPVVRHYLEGTVNGAGAALDWTWQLFGAGDSTGRLAEWLDQIIDPCLFINTVGGLGAPWWRTGGAPYFTRSDIGLAEAAVAVIESILFLLHANIERLRTVDTDVACIRLGGGLAAPDGLCRRLANLSGLPVERPLQREATARGIAWQAAGGPEAWAEFEPAGVFEPQQDAALQARYQRFLEIIATL